MKWEEIFPSFPVAWTLKQIFKFLFCDIYRGPFPKELYVGGQDHFEETLPCLCSHLPSALWLCYPAAGGGAPQHLLQALYFLCSGVYLWPWDVRVGWFCLLQVDECLASSNINISLSFFQEFNLIDRKELAPLQELIEKLTSKDR